MARKRSTPKPPGKAPAVIPFPGDVPDELAGMLGGAARLMGAIRTRRVILQRSQVVADPEGLADDGPNTLSLDPPESVYDFDPKSRRLRVTCHCRLTASRGVTADRKKRGDAIPLLIVEAAFLLEYEVHPDAVPGIDDAVLDVFCDAALAQAWPYWRDFVRDSSTRAGLPFIDVPFDLEF